MFFFFSSPFFYLIVYIYLMNFGYIIHIHSIIIIKKNILTKYGWSNDIIVNYYLILKFYYNKKPSVTFQK